LQLDADEIIDQVHAQVLEKPTRTIDDVPTGAVNVEVGLNRNPAFIQPVGSSRKRNFGPRPSPTNPSGLLVQCF
jgi:hypothetical protein